MAPMAATSAAVSRASCDWDTAGKRSSFLLSNLTDTCLRNPNSIEKEDFSRTERRQKAIAFLDNPELLMVHAQSTGEVSFRFSPLPADSRSNTHSEHPGYTPAFYEATLRLRRRRV
jgi:hypothetical protein